MKKTLLATAIAGVLGTMAAGAQAATVYNQDGSKLDVYGNVQLGWKNVKDAEGKLRDELFDNGSTVGFRGEHIINPELTGYFRAEFEFNADRQKGFYDDGASSGKYGHSGLSTGDQSYLGLTGNFGDVRIGSWDSLMNDWIDDPVSNNEFFDITRAEQDLSSRDLEVNKVTYTSPILSGFQFAIGTQYIGDDDGVGSRINRAGAPNQYQISDSGSASLFAGLRYMVGDWTLAAVYDDLNNFEYTNSAGDDKDYGELYGLNATWQMNDDLRISAKAERMAGNWASDADVDRYGVGARYSYGTGDIYGAYQYVRAEENGVLSVDPTLWNNRGGLAGDQHKETYNEFILGATYNLSSQMYVWLEGGIQDREADAGNGFGTGIAYSF